MTLSRKDRGTGMRASFASVAKAGHWQGGNAGINACSTPCGRQYKLPALPYVDRASECRAGL